MTRRVRPALPAAALLSLAVAACQAPVRPDPTEPAEPVAVVAIRPAVVATPPVDAQPPPPPPVEPDPVDTGAEVFDRMAARFTPPVCVKGERNRAWRRRYAGHPAVFARHVEAVLPLMAYVLAEVEARDLPGEFVLIPLVESWYRPDAIGPGGPAGMWQMIGSTARNHGIAIQNGYDGRLSPVASTEAALGYLQTLSEMFDGEWRAIAMGYNAGENRILRAFRAGDDRRVSGERRLPHGLSPVTYDYVAKLRGARLPVRETGARRAGAAARNAFPAADATGVAPRHHQPRPGGGAARRRRRRAAQAQSRVPRRAGTERRAAPGAGADDVADGAVDRA